MFEDRDYMDENRREKIRLLPAWFCERMMSRDGTYALVLNGGITVGVKKILQMHQDSASRIWLDIELMPLAEAEVHLSNGGSQSRPIIGATGDQKKATLNAECIMLAYELGSRYDMGEN
jgi:hypothetical protein